MSYISLNTHSEYSLLQSPNRIEELLEIAKKNSMPALALTDINVMYGAMEFYLKAKESGIKPIVGCQFNLWDEKLTDKNFTEIANNNNFFQVTMLAKNKNGYLKIGNLSTLASQNFYTTKKKDKNIAQAFITKENIKQITDEQEKDIIFLSGNYKSEIVYFLQNKKIVPLKETIQFYQKRFRENFYLQLEPFFEDLEKREIFNKILQVANSCKIEVVATNEIFYLQKEDKIKQDILCCIDKGQLLQDFQKERVLEQTNQKTNEQNNGYFLTHEEMQIFYQNCPQALENTLEISQQCQLDLPQEKIHMPNFPIPDGVTEGDYLREICSEKLQQITAEKKLNHEKYLKRLDYELKIIIDMGFSGYFLIVRDIIQGAKKKGILVGPGRGSAAGSLVAYLCNITAVDPIEYNLLFERFLNPERISMPDIDIDFQDSRRDEVIDYIKQRYGKEKTCQIITYGKFKKKAVMKDVARVLGKSFEESQKITKLLDRDKVSLKYSLQEEYEKYDDFRSAIDLDETNKKIYTYSCQLENLTRQVGIHAAGLIIADKEIEEYCPKIFFENDGEGQIVSQYEAKYLESQCGLLKMDILGLANLGIIDWTIKQVSKNYGKQIDIDKISFDDEKVYEIFQKAKTNAVFQFESVGMKKYLKELKPKNIENLILLNAAYRPGPMDWIPTYISKEHQQPLQFRDSDKEKAYFQLEKICQKDAPLKNALEKTHLLPIYQEQIMEIGRVYAGYSLAKSDIMRRTMGKKEYDQEKLQKNRKDFVDAAVQNGKNEKEAYFLAEKVIEPFSGYGFNRSHSVAYSVLAYQIAYLKTYYPLEFFTSVFNSHLNSLSKLEGYVKESLEFKIEINPPDINLSDSKFTIQKKIKEKTEGEQKQIIYYGLTALKGVGDKVSPKIITERKNGNYKNFFDFCKRNFDHLNKGVIESLIKGNSFRNFRENFLNNNQLLAIYPMVMQVVEDYESLNSGGQISFLQPSSENQLTQFNQLLEKEILVEKEKKKIKQLSISFVQQKNQEKEAIGFNLTYREVQFFQKELNSHSRDSLSSYNKWQNGQIKKIAGVIQKVEVRNTRENKEMANLCFETTQGDLEFVCFAKNWINCKEFSTIGNMIVATFRVSVSSERGMNFHLLEVEKLNFKEKL